MLLGRINRHKRLYSVTGVIALQADSVVDIIGVNMHNNYLGSVYTTNWATWIKPRLAELGIRHVRDQCGEDADSGTKARFIELKTELGITILMNPRNLLVPANAATEAAGSAAYMATINTTAPGTIDAVEPLNEHDLTGGAWAEDNETFGEALYTALAGSGATSSCFRLGPSFANTRDSPAAQLTAWPDSSSFIQVGNMHDYSGEAPEGILGGGWGITVQAAIDAYRVLLPGGATVWTSEIGHKVAGGVAGFPTTTQRAAAKYILRSILYHLKLGVGRFHIYQLIDTTENFGLLTSSNVERQHFTAIKNLIALMADPGSQFVTSNLNYNLTGTLTNIQQMLFQKRNGRYYLVLWLGVNSSSGGVTDGTEADVESTAVAITVSTPSRTWTAVNVYEPTFGTATVANFSAVSSFGVNVDDHLCVIEMVP